MSDVKKEAMNYILKGYTKKDVIEAIVEIHNTTEKKATEIVREAIDDIFDNDFNDVEFSKNFCIQAMVMIYRELIKVGDNAGALKAIKEVHTIASKEMQTRNKEENKGNENWREQIKIV